MQTFIISQVNQRMKHQFIRLPTTKSKNTELVRNHGNNAKVSLKRNCISDEN